MINRLSNLFGDEFRYYRLLLVVGGTIAILKGLRLPYIWAATQAQLDYRYGYVRRGLFGEFCRRLHIPIQHYAVFCVVSFMLLAALFWMFWRTMRRSGLDAASLGVFTALLASSFCITLLTNLVGYYDIPMAMMVLAVMQFNAPRVQAIAALLAAIAGVLMHDLYAIAYLPVSLAGIACALDEGTYRRKGLIALTTAAIIVPWTIVLLPAGRLTTAAIAQLNGAIHTRIDFPFHEGVLLAIFSDSIHANVARMLGNMRAGTYWIEECFALLAFLPATLFFLAAAWRIAGKERRQLRLYFAICTFAPLLLNLVAYDRYCWLGMMELNAAICAMAVCWRRSLTSDRQAELRFGMKWRRAAILLIALNLATDVGLFQGSSHPFPFLSYWGDYKAAKQAHRPILQPPEI